MLQKTQRILKKQTLQERTPKLELVYKLLQKFKKTIYHKILHEKRMVILMQFKIMPACRDLLDCGTGTAPGGFLGIFIWIGL